MNLVTTAVTAALETLFKIVGPLINMMSSPPRAAVAQKPDEAQHLQQRLTVICMEGVCFEWMAHTHTHTAAL